MAQEVNAMTRQMTQLDVYLWSLGDLPTLMGYTVLAAAIPILPSARAIMFGEKTEFVFIFGNVQMHAPLKMVRPLFPRAWPTAPLLLLLHF